MSRPVRMMAVSQLLWQIERKSLCDLSFNNVVEPLGLLMKSVYNAALLSFCIGL